MPLEKKVTNYIRAGFPILSINTTEETRTLDMLKQIAKEKKIKLYVFSITRGVVELTNGSTKNDIDDPSKFVQFVIDQKEEGIYCILDPWPFFKNEDPIFLRSLKDGIPYFRQGKPVILIGSCIQIPNDISSFVTKVDSPLPNREKLEEVINDVLPEDFDVKEDDIDKAITALSGLSTDEASDAVALSLVETKTLSPEVMLREKCAQLSKKEFLEVIGEVPSIEEVGGLDELKDWLFKRVAVFSKKARDYNLPTPKGFLMIGVSGCGKSLIAKATASILKIPIIKLDVGKLMSKWVGDSEGNVATAIKIADAMSPVVLWIDELDKQFTASGGSADGGHEVTKRVMSQLLTWLQEKKSPVFVVATANNIQALANAFPELLRKGRWNETFFVDLPTTEEREKIFEIHIRKNKRDPKDYDVKLLAKTTDTWSGAEIEAVIEDALYLAFDQNNELDTSYIMQAIDSTVPQYRMSGQTVDALRKWADGRARKATSKKEVDGKRKIDL